MTQPKPLPFSIKALRPLAWNNIPIGGLMLYVLLRMVIDSFLFEVASWVIPVLFTLLVVLSIFGIRVLFFNTKSPTSWRVQDVRPYDDRFSYFRHGTEWWVRYRDVERIKVLKTKTGEIVQVGLFISDRKAPVVLFGMVGLAEFVAQIQASSSAKVTQNRYRYWPFWVSVGFFFLHGFFREAFVVPSFVTAQLFNIFLVALVQFNSWPFLVRRTRIIVLGIVMPILAFVVVGLMVITLGFSEAHPCNLWQRIADRTGCIYWSESANNALFVNDGSRLLVGSRGRIKEYSWQNSFFQQAERTDLDGGSNVVAVSPDGRFVVSEYVGDLVVYSAETGEKIAKPYGRAFNQPVFSADGRWLITDQLWDTTTWEVLEEYGAYHVLAVSQDGQLVALYDREGSIQIVEIESDVVRQTLGDVHFRIEYAAFSPDGAWLVANRDDGFVYAWELSSGRVYQTPIAENVQSVTRIEFLPNTGHFVMVYEHLPGRYTDELRSHSDLRSDLQYWQIEDTGPSLVKTIPLGSRHPETIDVSANGEWIVFSEWHGLMIFSVNIDE